MKNMIVVLLLLNGSGGLCGSVGGLIMECWDFLIDCNYS